MVVLKPMDQLEIRNYGDGRRKGLFIECNMNVI